MQRILVRSKVGSDGVLHLSLPLGLEDVDREVQVTVESCSPSPAMTPTEWCEWVDSMAGSWQGDFERPAQGEYEVREPLS